MASAFGHALTAFTFGKVFTKALSSWKFILLGIFCSVVPDADVITFRMGIPYEDMYGHRGFFHSFLFSGILALLVTVIFYPRKIGKWQGVGLMIYFFLCASSHSLLDAMTTGGLGVAFFAPWDNTRYFLPWRVIQVSPIGIEHFFSDSGWRVLKSELIWIGVPCIAVLLLSWLVRYFRKRRTSGGSSAS